jgi:hypothetical protein
MKNLYYVQPDLSLPRQFYECSSLGFLICAESEDEAKILSSTLPENVKELRFVVKFLEIADQNIPKGMINPARSPQPENPANCEGEDWEESEQICPDCGQLVWTASWWDDCSDIGGAAIGTLFECGNCGYRNSQ